MRMNGCAEDILGHINGIGDDNNICNTLYLRWSTNATSNSKKFSFGWWNIYSMINGFDNDFILSGTVHTRVEVCRMDPEMSRLVEWPWLQLICCTICLPCGRNFRWWGEVWDGSKCWMVCRHWTPEIEFNKRLSSLIIRLVNYNVTTSLIYKLIV